MGIRCSVLAEAAQEKDARSLQMARDPGPGMLRLRLIRLCVTNKTINYSTSTRDLTGFQNDSALLAVSENLSFWKDVRKM